jgi:hypothetical protein
MRRPLFLPAVVLLLLSSVFLFIVLKSVDHPMGRIFSPSRTSASWSVLEEIRSIGVLETAGCKLKVVFPFDFIGDDRNANWQYLKYQYDLDPRLFPAKSNPAWHPGGRLPYAWRHAEIYALCRKVGIDPGRPDYRFVVLSVCVSAGVDMDSWLKLFSAGEPQDEVAGILITTDDEGMKRLEMPSPPVAVTSFSVEDLDTTSDGYPDVALSPKDWGVLVGGLKTRLTDMAMDSGLVEAAEQGSRSFFTEIFIAAGYKDVCFTD